MLPVLICLAPDVQVSNSNDYCPCHCFDLCQHHHHQIVIIILIIFAKRYSFPLREGERLLPSLFFRCSFPVTYMYGLPSVT